MEENFETRLLVNNKEIDLNPFVEQFLGGTVVGGVRTLKGVTDVRTVELRMVKRSVSILINGKDLALTQFPNDIIASTVVGLVSALKGVDRVDNLQIDIKLRQKKW